VSDALRAQALRLLARREHTRAELQQKLAAAGDAPQIAVLLDQLEAAGLLSDARFAESFVASRAARFGAARLRHELRLRGVADQLIDEALATGTDELARAREVWRRKFGVPPADARDYGRQLRFLQSRGFSVDTFKSLLKSPEQQ
jgi:regulatory protein